MVILWLSVYLQWTLLDRQTACVGDDDGATSQAGQWSGRVGGCHRGSPSRAGSTLTNPGALRREALQADAEVCLVPCRKGMQANTQVSWPLSRSCTKECQVCIVPSLRRYASKKLGFLCINSPHRKSSQGNAEVWFVPLWRRCASERLNVPCRSCQKLMQKNGQVRPVPHVSLTWAGGDVDLYVLMKSEGTQRDKCQSEGRGDGEKEGGSET